MEKKCQRCGKTFTTSTGNYKYCDACQNEYEKLLETHTAQKDKKSYVRHCPVCGKDFTTNIYNKKYCSQECYEEGSKQIKREQYQAKKSNFKGKTACQNDLKINYTEETENVATEEIKVVDVVNHPKHYEVWDGLEAKEIVRMLLTEEEYNGWCKGNLIKYRMRAGLKNPHKIVEDIEKAEWFKRELVQHGD